jgi:hypothetical protein
MPVKRIIHQKINRSNSTNTATDGRSRHGMAAAEELPTEENRYPVNHICSCVKILTETVLHRAAIPYGRNRQTAEVKPVRHGVLFSEIKRRNRFQKAPTSPVLRPVKLLHRTAKRKNENIRRHIQKNSLIENSADSHCHRWIDVIIFDCFFRIHASICGLRAHIITGFMV